MLRLFLHGLVVIVLTILTQIGGVAWLVACLFRRRLLALLVVYAALAAATVSVAPFFGRVALSCSEDGPLVVQSWVYCALNRNYVSPEMAQVLEQTADAMNQSFPGTVTMVLDGNFPFLDGFPLLPHLSHDDGDKADIAFFYREGNEYLVGQTRSPIGYFAFEAGPTDCPDDWPTMRWNFHSVQSLWPEYEIDADRNRRVLQLLASDERVGKVFIEPHLAARLGVTHEKIRFQGCRAARHDDHIHIELR